MQRLKRKPLLTRLDDTLKKSLSLPSLLGGWQRLSPAFRQTVVSIIMLLLMCLTLYGCATAPKPILPPQADARPVPEFTGQTYREVILWAIDLREGWMSCEYDKQVWRELHQGAGK